MISWLQRRAHWISRLIEGGRTWFERRLTVAGWSVFLALFITTGIGFPITEQSVAYKASTFLAALLACSWVLSITQRDRLKVQRILPRHGTVGERLVYRVRVENLRAVPREGLAWREEIDRVPAEFSEFLRLIRSMRRLRSGRSLSGSMVSLVPARAADQPLPDLPPSGRCEATAVLIPMRRGVLRLESGCVTRTEWLGLMRSSVRVRLPQSLVILPRRYPLPPLALPGSPRLQAGGVAQASSVGESEEFIGLRDYRRGDSPRRIHWKSWARAGRPVVKEYQDEFFVRHALILDTFMPGRAEAAFEEAVSIAASFACTVPSQDSLLDLLFIEREPVLFTVGRAVAHPQQMLEVLAAAAPADGRPFESLQELVLSHIRLVCGCIVVLLAWDEPRRELVRRLGAARVAVLVLVVSSDARPADLGVLEGVDPARFHWIQVGRVGEGLARL